MLQVIQYPHPTLARKSKPLRKVDAELRRIVAEMFDLMYQHKGCGLAANQVDLPYRLFVINPSGDSSQRDQEQVFINPVLSKAKGSAEAEEGCLSLPGLYAPVRRPTTVHVNAYDMQGQELSFEADKFLARVIQHETDHVDGVMIVDRLSPTNLMAVREQLDEMINEFQQRRERGEIPGDPEIASRWAELEGLRT